MGLVSAEDGQERIAIQVRLFSSVRNSQAREVIADTRQLRLQIKRVLDMESANWIKVEDRLPEDGQACLIVTKPNVLCFKAKWSERHRVFFVDNTELGYYKSALTHWMPIVLPEDDCKGMDSKLSPLAKPCPNFTPKEN